MLRAYLTFHVTVQVCYWLTVQNVEVNSNRRVCSVSVLTLTRFVSVRRLSVLRPLLLSVSVATPSTATTTSAVSSL